jgi:ribosome-binding protein aMBF1 (putative translation factor)
MTKTIGGFGKTRKPSFLDYLPFGNRFYKMILADEGRDLCRAFGEIVLKRREALGLSLRDVAMKAGLREQGLALMETGTRRPSLDTLYRVAHALSVTAADLIAESEELAEIL